MNPYQKYRRLDEHTSRTRMDSLIALYDKALERLDKAEAALRAGDTAAAIPHLSKTQIIGIALASGVRVHINTKVNMTILRLYEFAVRSLGTPSLEGIGTARTAFRTLRDAFEKLRAEANELERSGKIPSLERVQLFQSMA